MAACGQLDRAMPLDALLTALASLLRRLGPEATADLLGADAPMLAPLLGAAPGPRPPPVLADSMLGPAVLYAALARVLGRLAERGPLVVVIDDAHLAGPALPDWLRFVRRGSVAVAVVAAVRPGEGEPCRPPRSSTWTCSAGRRPPSWSGRPASTSCTRAPRAIRCSSPSWRSSRRARSCPRRWSSRCPLGATSWARAGALLRTAAVIGPELDLDLLAAVLGRGVVELLDDAERAAAKQFLADEDGTFWFRHELVREALAASATAGRAALLHRQAGRVLARRPAADPVTVAHHARLGGDLALASRALADAAARAAERFDHAAAEALLDDALRLHPEPEGWLARARVRTRRGHYREALADVERAAAAGPAALEVGAWASYFGRQLRPGRPVRARTARWPRPTRRPGPGAWRSAAAPATPPVTWPRRSCCSVRRSRSPRARTGSPRPPGWACCGPTRAGRPRRCRCCARRPAGRWARSTPRPPCTRCCSPGTRTRWRARPALALAAFARYTAEVERRQVPRFAGRAVNFAGWVLRNLGAAAGGARPAHRRRWRWRGARGPPEVTIAALEDLAEQCLDAGDADGAQARLAQALALLRTATWFSAGGWS